MSLKNSLYNHHIGNILLKVRETGSTNEEAHALALQGFEEGTVITAERQTKGRGRRGNQWHSPEGGLYCSCILRPPVAPYEVCILEKLAGISVWDTVRYLIQREPQLKPPNDILINGRKVAGILIESRGGEGRLEYVVVGVGVNCSTPHTLFPSGMRSGITTLSCEASRYIPPSDTLDIFLTYINYWYILFMNNERAYITNQWDALARKGRHVQIASCY